MNMQRGFCGLMALLGIAAGSAVAQDYPAKPIRLIIPFAAGSVAELIFRTLSPAAESRLNQRFIVEPKPARHVFGNDMDELECLDRAVELEVHVVKAAWHARRT